jgi:hypothetical protein
LAARSIVALRPVIEIPQDIYDRLSRLQNSHICHAGLKVRCGTYQESVVLDCA